MNAKLESWLRDIAQVIPASDIDAIVADAKKAVAGLPLTETTAPGLDVLVEGIVRDAIEAALKAFVATAIQHVDSLLTP